MLLIVWIVTAIVGRLVIHIPDVTPLTSLCLLAPSVFSKRTALFAMLIILALSDYGLHLLFQYSVFGSWTWFTYSGWLCMIFLGFIFSKNSTLLRALYFTLIGTVIFWLWTNFGTWCTTTLYPHHLTGLFACYTAALPFLKNSVLGSLLWTTVLFTFVFYKRSLSLPYKADSVTT